MKIICVHFTTTTTFIHFLHNLDLTVLLNVYISMSLFCQSVRGFSNTTTSSNTYSLSHFLLSLSTHTRTHTCVWTHSLFLIEAPLQHQLEQPTKSATVSQFNPKTSRAFRFSPKTDLSSHKLRLSNISYSRVVTLYLQLQKRDPFCMQARPIQSCIFDSQSKKCNV